MRLETQAEYVGAIRSTRELEDALAQMLDRDRELTRTASGKASTGDESRDLEREALIQHAIRSGIESELYSRYRDLGAFEAGHPTRAADRLNGYGHNPGWDLVRARVAAGLRQADLAQALGLEEGVILALELDHYADASLELLLRVARAVGTEIRVVQAVG